MAKIQRNASAAARPSGIWHSDRWAGAGLTAAGAYTAWESAKLPLGAIDNPGPGYLPLILAALLTGLGILITLAAKPVPAGRKFRWAELRHGAAIVSSVAFAALTMESLGYRLTVALVLVFLLGVVERKPLWAVAGFAVGMSMGSHWLFSTLLKVPLPSGLFGL